MLHHLGRTAAEKRLALRKTNKRRLEGLIQSEQGFFNCG